MHRRSSLAALCALAAACAPDLPRSPRANVIHAVFDPDSGRVPQPSNLAREPMDGTFPAGAHLALPLPANPPAALSAIAGAFARVDGWSAASVAEVDFSGEIDPASVTKDTLLLYKGAAPGGQLTPMAWRLASEKDPSSGNLPWLELVDGARLRLHPPLPSGAGAPASGVWDAGETYLVAVRGGAQGVQGAPKPEGAARVECDAAFYLLRSTQRLDTPEHESAFPYDTHAERVAHQKQAEAARETLAPLFDALATGPAWSRSEVASLWTFTVTRRPELFYDPDSARIPTPNDLLLDRSTGKVNVPILPGDDDTTRAVKQGLDTLDGFSVSGDVTLRFTRPIDTSTVTDQTILLVRADTGKPVPWRFEALSDDQTIYVHVVQYQTDSLRPLDESTRYAAFVTDGVKGKDGAPVAAMPLGVLTALGVSLQDGGHSAVPALFSDAQAAQLEPVREEVRGALAAAGVDAAHLAGAAPFTTLSISPELLALRDEARTRGPTTAVTGVTTATPASMGMLTMPNVASIVRGDLSIADHLDPATHAWTEAAQVKQIPFDLCVPAGGAPFKIALFGHGLTTSRDLVYVVCDTLAAHGYAAIAIDFPYHGARPGYCTQDLDCAGGTCNPNGACDNGNAVISGTGFIDVAHLFASRDHFRQAAMDLHQLVRVVEDPAFATSTGVQLDTAHIEYTGISLGGIMGSIFVPLEPDVEAAGLNVAGADLADLMANSATFRPVLLAGLAQKGISPGTDAYFNFVNAARWALDGVDPENVMPHIRAAPFTIGGKAVAHRAFVQEAQLDTVIPPWCEGYDGLLGGIEVVTWGPTGDGFDAGGSHVFLATNPQAQDQIASFFDGKNP